MKKNHNQNYLEIFVFRRALALFILIAFIFTNHLAFPAYASSDLLRNLETKNLPSDLNSIRVPEQLGKIQEFYKGVTDRVKTSQFGSGQNQPGLI